MQTSRAGSQRAPDLPTREPQEIHEEAYQGRVSQRHCTTHVGRHDEPTDGRSDAGTHEHFRQCHRKARCPRQSHTILPIPKRLGKVDQSLHKFHDLEDLFFLPGLANDLHPDWETVHLRSIISWVG